MFVAIIWEKQDIKKGLKVECSDSTKYMVGCDKDGNFRLVCLTSGFVGPIQLPECIADNLNNYKMKPVDFPKFVEEKV